MQTNIEPLPTSTGTISLSDRTDPVFGQREVEVDWQLTPTAKKTGEAMFDATRDALETLDYGSSFNIPQLDDDRVWSPGLHPMGTTRMAADQQDHRRRRGCCQGLWALSAGPDFAAAVCCMDVSVAGGAATTRLPFKR